MARAFVVPPTLAREPRQARKGATVAVTSVWRGLFYWGRRFGAPRLAVPPLTSGLLRSPRRGLWPRRGARLFESAGEAARGAVRAGRMWLRSPCRGRAHRPLPGDRGRRSVARGEVAAAGLRGARLPAGLRPSARPSAASRSAAVRVCGGGGPRGCGLGCGSRSGSSSRLVLRLGLWFALWLALELEAGAAAWARARARAAALEAGAVARARAVVRAGAGAGARARAPRASRPPRAQFLLSLRQTAHGLQPAPPLGLACAPTFSDRRFSPLPR